MPVWLVISNQSLSPMASPSTVNTVNCSTAHLPSSQPLISTSHCLHFTFTFTSYCACHVCQECMCVCLSNRKKTITWDFCAEFHTSTITYLENKWEFISLVRIVKCVCWKQLDDYLFIRICVLMCCWDVFTSQIYSEKDSLILYIYPTQKTRHNQSTQNTFYNDNFFLSPTRVNTSHCIANTAIGQGQDKAEQPQYLL